MATGADVQSGTNWEDALLDLVKAPKTPQNYQFINAWATREHGNSYPGSIFANNPFFTTAGGSGSAGQFKSGQFPLIPGSAFPGGANTAGVPQYPDIAVGVLATASTLQQQYPGIISALQSGDPSKFTQSPTFQTELSAWSGHGYTAIDAASAPAVAEGPKLDMPILNAGSLLTGLKSSPLPGVPQATKAGQEAVSALDSTGKALKFLFSYRFLEIVGGGALIIVGIVGLMKEVGVNVPVPGPKVG